MKTFSYILGGLFILIAIGSLIGIITGYYHQRYIFLFAAVMAFLLIKDAKKATL